MTTDAERECYYRLAHEAAGKGEIIELGAWLGASTAYIAAAIRDAGVEKKAHVYDKFQTRVGHVRKAEAFYKRNGGTIPTGPSFEQFQANLGPLIEYVEAHPGQIEEMKWARGPVALLVSDAPKRVPAISPVLTALRKALRPGAIMAWQDFCHFPSYEIPACLYRLRHHLEFVEAVVPGTTLVFRVKSQWSASEVSSRALALERWTANEVFDAWGYWLDGFVPAEKRDLFRCGAAMFLCDIGKPKTGAIALEGAIVERPDDVLKKWAYLRQHRPDFVARYAPLFERMAA